MKIPLKYTINYIVHAISILDLDLLTQILSPLADAVAEKVQVAQYIPDFERIFRIELDFEDTYFEMVQGLFEMEGSSDYKYTFIANYSLENFTLKIEETFNSIIIIQEFRAGINDRQNRFSSFKGKRIDAPF
jgi:hypothetical protein